MLIESMAGKTAALHGIAHDCTPFRFSEKETAVDYFGEQLRKAGYNYFGHERMYSGITGTEFEVREFESCCIALTLIRWTFSWELSTISVCVTWSPTSIKCEQLGPLTI